MLVDNYPKAYKEVLEILKFVPKEDVDKIPTEMIETFKIKQDKGYGFKVNISKPIEEQELLQETKAILANIFKDYWATPYQKERIEAKEKYDIAKEEEEKQKRYNPDEIFKNRKGKNNEETEENNNLPMEIKKKSFFERLLEFIKKMLRK